MTTPSKALTALTILAALALPLSTYADITTGLVAYYPLDTRDKATATSILDRSINNFTGTLSGSPPEAAGKIGQALSLSGTAQYATLPATVGSSYISIMDNFSISAWFYAKSGCSGVNCFILGSATSTTDRTQLELMSSGKFTGTTFDTRYHGFISNNVVSLNAWHHAVMTKSGSTYTLYIDDVSQSGAATGNSVTNVGTIIGAESNHTGALFNGYIDDVRIYNRAITATDIKQLYQLGLASHAK